MVKSQIHGYLDSLLKQDWINKHNLVNKGDISNRLEMLVRIDTTGNQETEINDLKTRYSETQKKISEMMTTANLLKAKINELEIKQTNQDEEFKPNYVSRDRFDYLYEAGEKVKKERDKVKDDGV